MEYTKENIIGAQFKHMNNINNPTSPTYTISKNTNNQLTISWGDWGGGKGNSGKQNYDYDTVLEYINTGIWVTINQIENNNYEIY